MPIAVSSISTPSVNKTCSSIDLDTPRDNIDDISSALTHTLEQDITNVDNSSETSESQSIDITSTNLNNHVAKDSEFSLSIQTSAPHSDDGVIQNQVNYLWETAVAPMNRNQST